MKPKSKLVQLQLDVLELKKAYRFQGKKYPIQFNILKSLGKDLIYFRNMLSTQLKLKTNRQCTNL